MRVVILSTESKHHTYFVNRIGREYDVPCIAYERRRLRKDYPTGPFLVAEEEAYEERFFEEGVEPEIRPDLRRRLIEVHDVNQPGVAEYLKALQPDIGITFGVGLVKPHVFTVPRFGTLNIHRGLVEHYRGLDSDLWAVYEGRFDRIGVTIHYVDEQLDTGPVVREAVVPIVPGDELFHLRYKTTVAATRMILDVLAMMQRTDAPAPGQRQARPGPYYSAMSLDDKLVSLERFRAHQATLDVGP